MGVCKDKKPQEARRWSVGADGMNFGAERVNVCWKQCSVWLAEVDVGNHL